MGLIGVEKSQDIGHRLPIRPIGHHRRMGADVLIQFQPLLHLSVHPFQPTLHHFIQISIQQLRLTVFHPLQPLLEQIIHALEQLLCHLHRTELLSAMV